MQHFRKSIYCLSVVFSFLFFSCSDDSSVDTIPVDDDPIDILKGVVIGDQTWASKNLEVDRFANGDQIPFAQTAQQWSEASRNKTPAYCYYDFDPTNGTQYGKLYNWFAVSDRRGLSPLGWHVPTDAEWKQLEDYLGGSKVAGKKLKAPTLWLEQGFGDDVFGWTGLPGGLCTGTANFDSIRRTGGWWTSTEQFENAAVKYLYYNLDEVGGYRVPKVSGFSVRCVKD
jgi:uncharacterized protein (TIGR02145 family)